MEEEEAEMERESGETVAGERAFVITCLVVVVVVVVAVGWRRETIRSMREAWWWWWWWWCGVGGGFTSAEIPAFPGRVCSWERGRRAARRPRSDAANCPPVGCTACTAAGTATDWRRCSACPPTTPPTTTMTSLLGSLVTQSATRK